MGQLCVPDAETLFLKMILAFQCTTSKPDALVQGLLLKCITDNRDRFLTCVKSPFKQDLACCLI